MNLYEKLKSKIPTLTQEDFEVLKLRYTETKLSMIAKEPSGCYIDSLVIFLESKNISCGEY